MSCDSAGSQVAVGSQKTAAPEGRYAETEPGEKLPKQPGYNKRLPKAAELLRRITRLLATDTSVWSDDVWIVESTLVECGRSRETVKRSDLAGWAAYGYVASHSRFFWGLRLHLVCTPHGLPIAFALTGAEADERETLLDLLAAEPELVAARPGQTLIGDKNYFGRDFEHQLAELDVRLLRPITAFCDTLQRAVS